MSLFPERWYLRQLSFSGSSSYHRVALNLTHTNVGSVIGWFNPMYSKMLMYAFVSADYCNLRPPLLFWNFTGWSGWYFCRWEQLLSETKLWGWTISGEVSIQRWSREYWVHCDQLRNELPLTNFLVNIEFKTIKTSLVTTCQSNWQLQF